MAMVFSKMQTKEYRLQPVLHKIYLILNAYRIINEILEISLVVCKMKSVALLIGSKHTDGISYGIKAYKKALLDLDFKVTTYRCLDGHPNDGSDNDEVVVKGIGEFFGVVGMGLNRTLIFPRKLSKLTEDIIFLSDPSLLEISKYYKNVILKLHDLRPLTEFRDRISTSLLFRKEVSRLRKLSRIIVTTEYMKNELVRIGVGQDKISIVPEIANFNQDSGHQKRSIERISEKKVVNLLYVATDRPYKNIGFYIHLSKMFLSMQTDLEIKFTLLSNLKKKNMVELNRNHLPNLSVINHVNDIEEIYNRTDILIYPSLYEGFGRPIVEAMRFGIPIIATDIGPFDEIIRDAGFLVAENDVSAWARAIIEMCDPSVYTDKSGKSLKRGNYYSYETLRKSLQAATAGL